jgi:predicted DNA-binding transcriptional regulator AlpA
MAEVYLTIDEVAERYRMSIATVRRAWYAGVLPAPYRLARGLTRWRLADLERYDKHSRPLPRPTPTTEVVS